MNPLLAFFLGLAVAELGRIVGQHIQPRRGVPSPAQRARLIQEREHTLAHDCQAWAEWGSYVAGVAAAKSITLPAPPAPPSWAQPVTPTAAASG